MRSRTIAVAATTHQSGAEASRVDRSRDVGHIDRTPDRGSMDGSMDRSADSLDR